MTALERLDAIDERTNGATRAPWREFGPDIYAVKDCGVEACTGCREVHLADIVADEDEADNREADAEFIAHARADVPVMATALRGLLALHDFEDSDGGVCGHDGEPWPCATVRIIETELAR